MLVGQNRDGDIRCWEDSWIPRVGPLIEHVSTPNRQTDSSKLRDMVTEEGARNLEAFREKKSYKR